MRRSKRRLRRRKLANYEARRSREFYRLREQARLRDMKVTPAKAELPWWANLLIGIGSGLLAMKVGQALVDCFFNM